MKKTALLILGLTLSLSGCKSDVRDSSPSLFRDGIQLQQKKVAVDAQHAKVIMKATGTVVPVEFAIRRAADPDQRMEVQGTVVDSGRGKVFGWIAKLNETTHSAVLKHFPQLEVQADPDQPFEVSGYATGESIHRGYRCGPVNNRFTPQKGKVYLVELQFVEGGCELHTYDVTQPQERIPVVGNSQNDGFANALPGCKSATASVNNQPVTTQFCIKSILFQPSQYRVSVNDQTVFSGTDYERVAFEKTVKEGAVSGGCDEILEAQLGNAQKPAALKDLPADIVKGCHITADAEDRSQPFSRDAACDKVLYKAMEPLSSKVTTVEIARQCSVRIGAQTVFDDRFNF
ncbi:hypothetical protein [Pseudomonas corrugata]|uniref:hypothetical protein n=1 Tax=Pseudomonas corrugata TaxID=47879 RepID=UPI000465796B|nr:hypothetical protein [Pseudomonas corrugata]